MPAKLASGPVTLSYCTPPNNEQRWLDLVTITLSTYSTSMGKPFIPGPLRFGTSLISTNFGLVMRRITCVSLKLPLMPSSNLMIALFIGVPAICGVQKEKWIKDFLDFCEEENFRLDFITRHFYMASVVLTSDHYRYPELRDLKESLHELKTSWK